MLGGLRIQFEVVLVVVVVLVVPEFWPNHGITNPRILLRAQTSQRCPLQNLLTCGVAENNEYASFDREVLTVDIHGYK